MAASSTTVAREASKLKRAKPDDETPKTKTLLREENRSKNPNPVLEFAATLHSRHGAGWDAKETIRICREELNRYDVEFREFVDWEPSKTLSHDKLTKPDAHYRVIARQYGRAHGALNSVDETMQRVERGRAALKAESRHKPACLHCQDGRLANDRYCDCKTGQLRKDVDAYVPATAAGRAAPSTHLANK